MKQLFSLIGVLVAMAAQMSAQTTSLQGKISINDSVAAAYATVFLPELGLGCITDDAGVYYMADIPVGEVKVEYSSMGFAPQSVRLRMTEANHPYAHDVRLVEQPIMLKEVYLTPNDEDPATYILRKMSEQAKVNDKRLQGYRAEVKGTVKSRDLDFVPALVPKSMMFMLRSMLRMAGVNTLFNHFFENAAVDASYEYVQTRKKSKVKSSSLKVYDDVPKMSEKAISGMELVVTGDLFDELYGNDCMWSYKQQKKSKKWQLEGVIEENGKTIDVLIYNLNSQNTTPNFAKVYIIEDVWGIQRIEYQTSIFSYSKECREVADGIYLPISVVYKPMPIDMRKLWNDAKNEADEEGKEPVLDSKEYKRMEQMFNGKRDYKPYAVFPYTVQYSEVVLRSNE